MAIKIYSLVWLLGILAVAVTYMAGYFTPIVAVTFGFLSFGAVFMGMIGVLPISVAEHRHAGHH